MELKNAEQRFVRLAVNKTNRNSLLVCIEEYVLKIRTTTDLYTSNDMSIGKAGTGNACTV